MKKYFLIVLSTLILSGVGFAKVTSDRNLPFLVEADAATYKDITQTTVFTGRVILTQGTIRIEADRVETIIDAEGYQFARATMSGGGLVQFTQVREGTNEIIKGQGAQLTYDGKSNNIEFAGHAQMRRLTPAGVMIDKIDGDILVYNQLTEIFESHASPKNAGRTRVIITPQSQAK